MSPNSVKDFFEEIVDDSPGETITFSLMDTAYTLINENRPWEFLKKLDTSITHTTSDTWQTEKTLPTDFSRSYRAYGGDSDNEYDEVPFEEILSFKGRSNKYAIDHANSKLRFMGPAGSALTLYLWYLYNPTSLIGLSEAQKSAVTTIVWPARFCLILAYKMAEIQFGGVDADDINRQMAPKDREAYTELKRSMVQWDNARKLKKMGGTSSPNRRTVRSNQPDIIYF